MSETKVVYATEGKNASTIAKFKEEIPRHNCKPNYFDSNMTNAALEGVNSIVQAAKTRAIGYRNVNNFIIMIYLLAGKLNINFQFHKQFYRNYGQPKLPLPA